MALIPEVDLQNKVNALLNRLQDRRNFAIDIQSLFQDLKDSRVRTPGLPASNGLVLAGNTDGSVFWTSGGGGGGSSTFAGLTDVALSSPAVYQGLFYNSVTSKWNNTTKNVFYTTITEIRSFPATSSSANVLYYTTDRGQEGFWYYDSTDTTTIDNTGLVLRSTVSNHRFKRIVVDNNLNVKWFGAKGDGTTNDKTNIQTAVNNIGGYTLLFTSGTYMIDGSITVSTNADIFIPKGVTLKMMGSITTNQRFFLINTANLIVSIRGEGTLDGNRSNIAAAVVLVGVGYQVSSTTSRLLIDGLTIRDMKTGYGVLLNNVDNVTINNCKFIDNEYIDIFCNNATKITKNIRITNNFIDKRSFGASVGAGSVSVRGSSTDNTIYLEDVLVHGNSIYLPIDATLAPDKIPIELFGFTFKGCVSNNNIEGGGIGISMAKCWRSTVVGNNVKGSKYFGYEISNCQNTTLSASTIDGAGVTLNGVSLNSGSINCVVDGITVKNVTTSCIEVNACTKNIISSCNLSAINNYSVRLLAASNENIITGGRFEGNTTALGAVIAENSSSITVTGISINSFANYNGLRLYCDTGTLDNMVFSNNIIAGGSNAGISGSPSAGGAFGSNIISSGNVGFSDYSDWNGRVGSFTGNGSPNSVVTASVGSIYRRKDGGSATTLYVKESGTNTNTGWVAVGAGGGSSTVVATLTSDGRSPAEYDFTIAHGGDGIVWRMKSAADGMYDQSPIVSYPDNNTVRFNIGILDPSITTTGKIFKIKYIV